MEAVGPVPLTNTKARIDEVIDDLTRPGRVPDQQTIKKLEEFRDALGSGQTFKELDTIRSDFREQVRGDISRVFPKRSEVQVNRIYEAMTNDLEGAIKRNLGDKDLKRWKAAKGAYAQEASKIKNTRLKNVLQKGDLTPEAAANVLFSQKPSEVRALYRSLDASGKEAARGTVLAKAIQRATNAEGEISPNGLATQLSKLKTQTDIIFPGLKGKELKGFVDYLNATRRAQDASTFTPTGQSLTALLGWYAALNDIFATAGASMTAGGIARVYESPAVRDALLKLANTQSGTTAFERASREVTRAATRAAQALKDEEPAEE
jgi:hypothetical protein